MIDCETGNFAVTDAEKAVAEAKEKLKAAKKRDAEKAKESAKARLSAFEDARATLNTKAKAFAKSGGKGSVETEELESAIADLRSAAVALSNKAGD